MKAIPAKVYDKWSDGITIAITNHKSITKAFEYASKHRLRSYKIETATRVIHSVNY